jgi:hypothetical protein
MTKQKVADAAALGHAGSNAFRDAVSNLKELGFIDATRGPGGGLKLMSAGVEYASRNSSPNS